MFKRKVNPNTNILKIDDSVVSTLFLITNFFKTKRLLRQLEMCDMSTQSKDTDMEEMET